MAAADKARSVQVDASTQLEVRCKVRACAHACVVVHGMMACMAAFHCVPDRPRLSLGMGPKPDWDGSCGVLPARCGEDTRSRAT